MESKKYYVFACCSVRLTASNRRPVKGRSFRLFVATRLFPNTLSTNAYICTKCHIMYKKVPGFWEFLQTIGSYPEVTTATTDNVDDEDEEMEECVNEEYIDDQAMDYTSDEIDSTDDGPVDASKVDSSANDDELFDEPPVNDQMKDEEMASDKNDIDVGSVLLTLFSPGLSFFR